MSDQQTTPERASVGDCVLVKGRPKPYRAMIEVDCYGRLTVRPLPNQSLTTRARAIWRKAILEVCHP